MSTEGYQRDIVGLNAAANFCLISVFFKFLHFQNFLNIHFIPLFLFFALFCGGFFPVQAGVVFGWVTPGLHCRGGELFVAFFLLCCKEGARLRRQGRPSRGLCCNQAKGWRQAPPKIARPESPASSTEVERVYTEKNRHSESVPRM